MEQRRWLSTEKELVDRAARPVASRCPSRRAPALNYLVTRAFSSPRTSNRFEFQVTHIGLVVAHWQPFALVWRAGRICTAWPAVIDANCQFCCPTERSGTH